MKLFAIPYSVACYLFSFAGLVALILFVGDLVSPWTINKASPLSPDLPGVVAVAANLALLLIWSLQHSIMADPRFKCVWTKIVPVAIERSTYILFVGLFTFGLIVFWSPLPTVFWDASGSFLGSLLWMGFWGGWAIALSSTFLINHLQLFGIEQAFRSLKRVAPKDENFVTPLFYRFVRHPMMTGILIALWCAPTMTLGRLIFNLAITGYIIVGTDHEEQTLVSELGEDYKRYQQATPKLIPRLTGSKKGEVV